MAKRIGGANMVAMVAVVGSLILACLVVIGIFTEVLSPVKPPAPDEHIDVKRPEVDCPAYPVASAYGYIVDHNNPTARITAFAEAFLYPAGTSKKEAVSPKTPYIDKALNEGGKINFKSGLVRSCTNYALLVKAPGYYCAFENVKTERKGEDVNFVVFEPSHIKLARAGSFHTLHVTEWTRPDGTALDGLCMNSSGGILTINRTRCTTESLDARILIQIGNTMPGTSLRDAVLQSMNDPSTPIQNTAITKTIITYREGTNFGLPGDVTQYIVQGLPITITNDLTFDKFGTVFLSLSIDNDTVGTGRFSISIDDLGGVNKDDGCGFHGALRKSVEIRVVA